MSKYSEHICEKLKEIKFCFSFFNSPTGFSIAQDAIDLIEKQEKEIERLSSNHPYKAGLEEGRRQVYESGVIDE